MKISSDFVLREIAGEYIVIPTGEKALKLNGLITINETGVFLWRLLQSGAEKEELLSALTAEFDVEEKQARADIDDFLGVLEKYRIL